MRRIHKITGFLVGLISVPFVANAGVADFAITDDFMDVCGYDYSSLGGLNSRFAAMGWSGASDDVKDFVSPDDFLKKVKKVSAFELIYEDGSGWYGASALGKFGKQKVVYCSVLAIDDDPDGYRQDFEKATDLVLQQVADSEIESRYAVQSGANTYVTREIRTPELSYFVYSKNMPLRAEGK